MSRSFGSNKGILSDVKDKGNRLTRRGSRDVPTDEKVFHNIV